MLEKRSDFAKRLRLVRISMDMTQEEFAEHLQCSSTTISAYETRMRMPSKDQIAKIAKELNVSVLWLTGYGKNFP